MEAVNRKRKRRLWTEETELAILKLWKENIMELRKSRNSHAYLEISKALGGRYNPKEVHVKINNFTQKYRNEKKRMSLYGGSPKWKYYNKVDRILDREFEPNFIEKLEELCEDNQSNYLDFSTLPSTSSTASSTPPLQAASILPPTIKVSTSPLPPPAPLRLALSPSPAPESISGFSATRRSKRKIVNSLTLQKDVLKISKENQAILREQSAFSRSTAREQLALAKKSLELLEENTKNSKYFASKIVDISEQQLKLEKDFMKIMKKVITKIDFNS